MEELQRYLPLLAPLVIIELTLVVISLVDLIRRQEVKYLPKWGWALVILLINLIGPILYLIIGREEAEVS